MVMDNTNLSLAEVREETEERFDAAMESLMDLIEWLDSLGADKGRLIDLTDEYLQKMEAESMRTA